LVVASFFATHTRLLPSASRFKKPVRSAVRRYRVRFTCALWCTAALFARVMMSCAKPSD
jgi:hypothetical protein